MADQTGAVDLQTLKRMKAEHDDEPDFTRQGHLYDQINAYFWEFQFDAILAALSPATGVELQEYDDLADENRRLALKRIPELERERDTAVAQVRDALEHVEAWTAEIARHQTELNRLRRVEEASASANRAYIKAIARQDDEGFIDGAPWGDWIRAMEALGAALAPASGKKGHP